MNVLEISKKMETDAIKFYTEASAKTNNPVCRKMFLTIAEDEKRHLEFITKLIKGLDITIKDVSPMKNIRTIFEEMKKDLMKKAAATSDELEAFKIAMRMEKQGVEFYKKAVLSAKTEKEKSLFAALIKEEQQHYEIFTNTHFFLSDTGNWFMWDEHSIVDGGTPWA